MSLEQPYTFGAVGSRPRERVVSVFQYALVKPEDHCAIASTDADETRWFAIDETPDLCLRPPQHL
ncbi:MAG: hypothetical protein R3F11_29580 [Verrucomicrobiales bacterium]